MGRIATKCWRLSVESIGQPEVYGRILVVMKPARAPQRRPLPGSPFNTPPVVRPVKTFALSDQVTHDRYGLGRVIEVDEAAVLVDFGDRTERICEPYPKLTRL